MSTNKTPNYHLHSWLPEDDFLRSEMNDNFTAIDTAIKSEVTAAAQARVALQTQLTGAINTGDSALQAAINTLTARCDKLQEVTGSYIGTYSGGGNEVPTTVTLGFRPKAVLILPNDHQTSADVTYIGLVVDGIATAQLTITDTGFIAKFPFNRTENYTSEGHPINPYRYIAWR